MTKATELQPIYTALNIPAATSYPSINCIQWTDDGQVCIMTRTAVYLLTPNLGINFDKDPSSVITAVVDKTAGKPPLGWFRTMIEFSKMPRTVWTDRCSDWSALSIGSLDVAVHQVACSPSNVTKSGGCVIATLSTNMDVTLWMSSRNHLRGEWVDILATLPLLDDIFDDKSSLENTLSTQISSIAWSEQPDFGINPAPSLDASILILGNRAGDMLFFRFDLDAHTLRHLTTVSVSNPGTWITHLAISNWSLVADGHVQSDIAYSTSSGAIGHVALSQHLEISAASFLERYETTFEATLPEPTPRPDGGVITALRWVHDDENKVLFHSKPGRFFFHHGVQADRKEFILYPKSPQLSVGSSSLSQVSGIYYWKRQKTLVVSLFDGSIHFVRDIFTQPRLENADSISRQARTLFSRAESGTITRSDMCSMMGLTSYDGSGGVLWVHESSQPADFSYKHDAKHNMMLIAARLWDEDAPEHVLEDLRNMLTSGRACKGVSPLHLLRPFFFLIQQKTNKYSSDVLNILQAPSPRQMILSVSSLPEGHAGLNDETKKAFMNSLHRNLYGWDVLQASRMKLALADFVWKLLTDEEQQKECGVIAHSILVSISGQFLEIMLKHLEVVVPLLQPTDMPFVDRIILQSTLPNTPFELSAQARSVWNLVHKVEGSSKEMDVVHDTMGEKCPACQGNVPLENITAATCVNGHQWPRCSVTSFLLATPLVRTCIGCSRKTFVPLSSRDENEGRMWLPEVARGWVVEQLLEAVNRCLFCGNTFVR